MKNQRDYQREYRLANREKVKEAQRAYDIRMRQLLDALKDRPCADCGGWFEPCQMDFDHRPGETKSFNISSRKGFYKGERLMAEIKKCDLVCANCHRIRTSRRRLYARITSSGDVYREFVDHFISSSSRTNRR